MKNKFFTITEAKLRRFTEDVFLAMGCSEAHASLAADVLVQADLRGIDSHGTARLSGYVRLWQQGRLNPQPQMKVVHETATTATVDGDQGLGLVVAPYAMEIAIDKAKQYGSGWVAVRNSNHFGIAGYHALMAVKQNMIGYAMTNASPLVTPTYSKERMLGTNPICYAFPAGKYPPVVVDMATSAAANGKLEIAQRNGAAIPSGWVQTAAGAPSTNAHELKQGGALLPLGGDKPHGSHKGFGLSATVDIHSAVLSGANYGPWAPPFVAYLQPHPHPVGLGLGHFLGAMRADGFRPLTEFKQHMDHWIERFKQAEPIQPNQPVIIPGEPEHQAAQERSIQGIPVIDVVWADLEQLAANLKINFF